MLPLIAAGLLAAAPDTLGPAAAPAQAAPALALHRQPALPVAALRMSVLADDPPGYAGAGHFIQHLQLPRLQEEAGRVGARVQAERTSDALVYTVTGPASELPALASVLRRALQPPRPAPADRFAAARALAEEGAALRDIAPNHMRAALRARLFPHELPAAGSEASLRRLADAPLDAVWAQIYAPERVSVVAVGGVELDDVAGALGTLPAPRPAELPALPDSVPGFEVHPQATRHWIAWAAPAPGDEPAAVTVTARLLRDRLRRSMTSSQVDVEHWWTSRGHAFAIVVATPGARAAVARRTVDGALAALAPAVTEAGTAAAAEAVRRDLLFHGRTPERMAETLGAFADRTGEADEAQRFFEALPRVDAGAVGRVIAALRAATPQVVEVAPQRLVPN